VPHLRFSRDPRGYENTYVVHTPRRRGSRGEPRILYWFRTPPGVRVGRSALDEEAIRLLEEHNPDVHFDWTRMLKQPQVTSPEARASERLARRRAQHPPSTRSSRPGGAPSPAAAGPPAQPPEAIEPEMPESDVADLDADESASLDVDSLELAGLAAPADAIEEEEEDEDEEPSRADGRPPTAAEARLGAEALARLRARYAEVLARIAERGGDEAARAELKDRAERLNPDAWVTDEEVRNALEQYEAVFDSLRSVIGHRRRRRRRRRNGASPGSDRGV
jgi:hypothetical protein